MPHYSDSKYVIHEVNGLPAGVFGESYVVAVSSQAAPGSFHGETYVLTQRPQNAVTIERIECAQGDTPKAVITFDHEFMLEECLLAGRRLINVRLDGRAVEHNAPHVALLPYELKARERPFVGCWMRNLFHSQLRQICDTTECESLYRYLADVQQMPTFLQR